MGAKPLSPGVWGGGAGGGGTTGAHTARANERTPPLSAASAAAVSWMGFNPDSWYRDSVLTPRPHPAHTLHPLRLLCLDRLSAAHKPAVCLTERRSQRGSSRAVQSRRRVSTEELVNFNVAVTHISHAVAVHAWTFAGKSLQQQSCALVQTDGAYYRDVIMI